MPRSWRRGSRSAKNINARINPGIPTAIKANCHGATMPIQGRLVSGEDLAQTSTVALNSDAMAAPMDMAML